jgi:hypothetical protein
LDPIKEILKDLPTGTSKADILTLVRIGTGFNLDIERYIFGSI